MAETRIASISGLRGIVGNGLDPISVVEYAAAYAGGCGPGPIVVGHDGRVSAPVFVNAVLAGVAATGRDVLLAGSAATPTIGRLVRDRSASGGIQISASHNPPEYNGLKLFQPQGMVLSAEGGRAVLARLGRREFNWAPYTALGKVHQLHNPEAEHLEAVLSIVDRDAIRARRFGVVLDACHGSGGRLGSALLHALGCRATILGADPDGRYDHPPEPTRDHLQVLCSRIPEESADIGFAQDPDADRLAIVDEKGRYIGEELTIALATWRRLLQTRGPVVVNLSTTRLIEDIAARYASPVFRTPVGEIHVVERLLAEKAVIGGEGNGGVIDPRVGYVRDSFLAMAMVLDLMAHTGQPLSQLVDSLPRYSMIKQRVPYHPDRTTLPIDVLLDQLGDRHSEAKADRRDGLRLDWPDRWAHIRTSNTEPILRVITEAPTPADATRLATDLESELALGTPA